MVNIASLQFGPEEQEAVAEVLRSGVVAQGPKVAEFEKAFAQYCDTVYAVALSSGTAALHTALEALNIKEGDEVITTPLTFIATANAILMQGAKAVFADVSADDFNIDPQSVERLITAKTKAIIPVDLYGQIYQGEAIKELAKQHNLKIIEDACQAIGASYKGKKAGNFGEIGVFSFYATKNITSGEGGMLVTNNKEYMERAKAFRHHGQLSRDKFQGLGYNYRLTDLAAALGIQQLMKVEDISKKRQRNAQVLGEGLSDIPGLVTPSVREGNSHVFHLFTVRLTGKFKGSRENLMKHLEKEGVRTGVYYPTSLNKIEHLKSRELCPVSEQMTREVLSLPVHQNLSEEDLETIITAMHSYEG